MVVFRRKAFLVPTTRSKVLWSPEWDPKQSELSPRKAVQSLHWVLLDFSRFRHRAHKVLTCPCCEHDSGEFDSTERHKWMLWWVRCCKAHMDTALKSWKIQLRTSPDQSCKDKGSTFLKGPITEIISIHTSRWWVLDLLSLSFCPADYQITIITRTHNLFIYRGKPKPQTHGFPQGCPRNSVEQHVRNGQGSPSQENPTQKEIIFTPCCKYKPNQKSDPKKGLWLIQHKLKQFLKVFIKILPV